MFHQPLSDLKTSHPLRSSDQRKLKQRVVNAYSLTPEEGDVLFPDGIMSVKFMTHVDAPGVAYLSADGEPLWFTIGKSTNDLLLPSVYTLWKKPDMLPFLSTPAAVFPVLLGGSDLMIPGVVQATPALGRGRLVCIRQYIRSNADAGTPPSLSAPVAVGRLALASDRLRHARASEKSNNGKAVDVLHTWKDHLWEMGGKSLSRREMPPDTPLTTSAKETEEAEAEDKEDEEKECAEAAVEADEDSDDDTPPVNGSSWSPPPTTASLSEQPPPTSDLSSSSSATENADTDADSGGIIYTPAEVSALLELALIQAIAKPLADAAASKALFPMPATKFYTDYILPCRPGFPTIVLPPSSATTANTPDDDAPPPHILTDLTIKSSSFKNLTAFLKSAEKAGLLSVKPPQKNQPDVLVTAVHADHARVDAHKAFGLFATVADVERTEAMRRARLEEQGTETSQARSNAGKAKAEAGLMIRELYAPEGAMKELFEAFGLTSPDAPDQVQRFTAAEIKSALSEHIARGRLVNVGDKAYVKLDAVLQCAVGMNPSSGGAANQKKGQKATVQEEPWLTRDELTKRILKSKKLQAWHEIRAPHQGAEAVLRRGVLQPISITAQTRAGRKVVTSVAGFEPFLSLPFTASDSGSAVGSGVSAEEMAEDLRKLCAGATTVGPTQADNGALKLPGGAPSQQAVTVQGKQGRRVLEYLLAKGVPKEWVRVNGSARAKVAKRRARGH